MHFLSGRGVSLSAVAAVGKRGGTHWTALWLAVRSNLMAAAAAQSGAATRRGRMIIAEGQSTLPSASRGVVLAASSKKGRSELRRDRFSSESDSDDEDSGSTRREERVQQVL